MLTSRTVASRDASAATNRLSDFITDAATFHTMVDDLIAAMARTDDASIASRESNLARLHSLVARCAHLSS